MKAKIEYKSSIVEQGSITLVHLKEDGTYTESTFPCDFTSLEQAQEKISKNSLIKEFKPALKKELDMSGYYVILEEDVKNFEDILARSTFRVKAQRKSKAKTMEEVFGIDKAVEQLKGSTGEE